MSDYDYIVSLISMSCVQIQITSFVWRIWTRNINDDKWITYDVGRPNTNQDTNDVVKEVYELFIKGFKIQFADEMKHFKQIGPKELLVFKESKALIDQVCKNV